MPANEVADNWEEVEAEDDVDEHIADDDYDAADFYDTQEPHEITPVVPERDEGFSVVQRPERRPQHRVNQMTNEKRKQQQTIIIKELSECIKNKLTTTNNTMLQHITQTVTRLIESCEDSEDMHASEFDSVKSASNVLKIVVWWFLGYDKDATINNFFNRYCRRINIEDEEARNTEWHKCAHRYADTKRKLHSTVSNAMRNPDAAHNLTKIVESALCQRTAVYFMNYRNQRAQEILAMKKARLTITRKYPEFEYWFWHTLQSLTPEQIKHYHLVIFKSGFTGKELAFEMVNQETHIRSNVEHCMLYFCENSYEPSNPNGTQQYGGPFGMMVNILFNSEVLDFFLNKIYLGILHDPKNPRDYVTSTFKLKQEKEAAHKERLDKIKEWAKLAREKNAARLAQASQELAVCTPAPPMISFQTDGFVYDFFSFYDVKYYVEFPDDGQGVPVIPPVELNRTELTYMTRIVGPPIYENYYENDLFDALAKSLNVDIYQELITKIPDAISWLKYNESFRTTLQQAGYIDSNKDNSDDSYEYMGRMFAKDGITNYEKPNAWEIQTKRERVRGNISMLDWVAKTLNKWIRVISIIDPNEKKETSIPENADANPENADADPWLAHYKKPFLPKAESDNIRRKLGIPPRQEKPYNLESLENQATAIQQLANTNGNTEGPSGPTTWLMSKNGGADTEWTWNAGGTKYAMDKNGIPFEVNQTENFLRTVQYSEKGAEKGASMPKLGDDYLKENQDKILYLFYEQLVLTDYFYCLTKCTKGDYDDHINNFKQRHKERQEQLQKVAAEEEEECAKKFPYIANYLFGMQFYMIRFEARHSIYWRAPFEMLFSVELKYVLGRIMQEISEYKANRSLDSINLETLNVLKPRILIHILMSLTSTRTKKQIHGDFYDKQESQHEQISEYIETMCDKILRNDVIISTYLQEIIQTSLTFLQDVAPKVKEYKVSEWKKSTNEIHILKLKNQIDMIISYLQEIIQQWCMEYCKPEEWTKWASSILQVPSLLLQEPSLPSLSSLQSLPSFQDKNTRKQACKCILIFGFYKDKDMQNKSLQPYGNCYQYSTEEQEEIQKRVNLTMRRLNEIKKNENKIPRDSQREGVVFRQNAWSNGLPQSLQNSAAPRAVDTRLQEQRITREESKRRKANNNNGNRPNPAPNRPNLLPPIPGALQRPEESVRLREIAQNVTRLPVFQSVLVTIMQAIVAFKRANPLLTEITPEYAELFCSATIMPLFNWIFGTHTYTNAQRLKVAEGWCHEFCKHEPNETEAKPLYRLVKQWFAMTESNIIQESNFSLLKFLIVNDISDVCQKLIDRDTITFENWLKSIVGYDKDLLVDISEYLTFYCTSMHIENRVAYLVRTLLLDDEERQKFLEDVPKHKLENGDPNLENADPFADINLEIEFDYYPFDPEKHKLIEMSRRDGHAVFAAVAQVLYYGAQTPAQIAPQHIWELRHGAAWMWLQYWRKTPEITGYAECSIDAMWTYYLELVFVEGTAPISVWGGSLAIEMLTNYIQRSIEVYERVANGNEILYKLVTVYSPTFQTDTLYDPIILVRSPPGEVDDTLYATPGGIMYQKTPYKIQDFDPRKPESYNISSEYSLKYHYDVIVPQEEVRPKKLLFMVNPETKNVLQDQTNAPLVRTPLFQRKTWESGKHVRGILRMFQWLLCDCDLQRQTREHPVNDMKLKRTWKYSVDAFMTRKWDNIFDQLKTQLTRLERFHFKADIQKQFWNFLIQLYTFKEDDTKTSLYSVHIDGDYNFQELVYKQYLTFVGSHVNQFDFFKFTATEADNEQIVVSLNPNIVNLPPVPATNPEFVENVDTWAISLKQLIHAVFEKRDEALNKGECYQAFIDIFCAIFNAHKKLRDERMEEIFGECMEMSDFCDMKHWKAVIELAMDVWTDILNAFCDVCDKVHSYNEFSDDFKNEHNGVRTTISWTKKEDMYKDNTTENKPPFLFLPLFKLTFLTKDSNDSQKPKAIFAQTTSTWFERLKKQTMECWMQKLFYWFPQLEDKKYDCFFYTKLRKIDIINFVKGEVKTTIKNGKIETHKFCLPENCFEQKNANGEDISDQDEELQKFKHQFFPKDKTITKLCKAIFRLRKICAFCREAKKYETFDDGGKRTGYNAGMVQQLQDSIPDSQCIVVPAANITGNASLNDFFVSHAPLLTDTDSRGTHNDLYLQTNQFFV
jgi:hypothetical protein